MRTPVLTAISLAACLSPTLVYSAPFASPNPQSAYSGAAGSANGGSVTASSGAGAQDNGLLGLGLVNIFSNNAGDGGSSSSGSATSFRRRSNTDSASKDDLYLNLTSSKASRNTGRADGLHPLTRRFRPRDMYTGNGGSADGGNVNNTGHNVTLLNVFSNNAGSGGSSVTGNADATGMDGDLSKEFTGGSGDARGGNVNATNGLVNVVSDNAGDGGSSLSGFSGSNLIAHGRRGYTVDSAQWRTTHQRRHTSSYPSDDWNSDKLTAGSRAASQHLMQGRAALKQTNATVAVVSEDEETDDAPLVYSSSLVAHPLAVQRRDSYTGAAGSAKGGDVSGTSGLVNLFSNNGGDGGESTSGSASTARIPTTGSGNDCSTCHGDFSNAHAQPTDDSGALGDPSDHDNTGPQIGTAPQQGAPTGSAPSGNPASSPFTGTVPVDDASGARPPPAGPQDGSASSAPNPAAGVNDAASSEPASSLPDSSANVPPIPPSTSPSDDSNGNGSASGTQPNFNVGSPPPSSPPASQNPGNQQSSPSPASALAPTSNVDPASGAPATSSPTPATNPIPLIPVSDPTTSFDLGPSATSTPSSLSAATPVPLDPTSSNSDSSSNPGFAPGQNTGFVPVSSASNSYSGASGEAQGGSVKGAPGSASLINLFSNNAGVGGQSGSGAAGSGSGFFGWSGASNAYSGGGGRAQGGDVNGAGGLINVFSNNAGDGGRSWSGVAQ